MGCVGTRMSLTRQSGGLVYAAGGGVFALCGVRMLLAQAVCGEWLFNGEGQQKTAGERVRLSYLWNRISRKVYSNGSRNTNYFRLRCSGRPGTPSESVRPMVL